MRAVPAGPKIYHITHVRNLGGIVAAGALWSDARRIELSLECEVVGMRSIKRRRLEQLEVSCHRGTKVGEYVPFYFCPRSVMLYILYMGNHPDLEYREGQRPIVHLQADLLKTVEWADANGVGWAFTDRNAGARYTGFYNSLVDLPRVDWEAVQASDFREPVVKDAKQAEFLVHNSFPWTLVERIGVLDAGVAKDVRAALAVGTHRPLVNVEQGWYY